MKQTLIITVLLLFVLLGTKTNAKTDTTRAYSYENSANGGIVMVVKTTVTNTESTTMEHSSLVPTPSALASETNTLKVMNGWTRGHTIEKNVVWNWWKFRYEFDQYSWNYRERYWTTELNKRVPFIRSLQIFLIILIAYFLLSLLLARMLFFDQKSAKKPNGELHFFIVSFFLSSLFGFYFFALAFNSINNHSFNWSMYPIAAIILLCTSYLSRTFVMAYLKHKPKSTKKVATA